MASRAYLLSLVSGVLSEVFLFSRGEWDRHAPTVLKTFTLSWIGGVGLLWKGSGLTLVASLRQSTLLGTSFLAGVFGSMAAYRLFFHPLRKFPGPIGARLSVFWIFRENIPDLKFYTKLRELHDQYGDFVRIRPREISICHPDAVADVHGHRNKIRKGEFYDQLYPHQSLQMTRDPVTHSHKRRFWDKAFQMKSVHDYMPRLTKHYSTLLDIFSQHAAEAKPIDVSQSFMFLGFDLVSELTFGESFNMLTTGKPNPIIAEFINGKKFVGFALISMWFFALIKSLPGVNSRIQFWLDWYGEALKKRKEMDLQSPDFYTHLSQSENFEYDGPHEAQLAIVAGSDTVAMTLSNICYLLCRYPEYQSKLYEEIGELPDEGGIINDQLLVGKPYLMGIINEALRLHPPVPSGVQRVTPPEGAVIAGRYIPGNMVVTTPTYALQRDARAFVKPNDFIPERWSLQPELVLRKDAFIPFSHGAYNCAGKPIALMELRMSMAMVIKRFSISFPPGQEAECHRYIEDQADCFVMHVHALPLLLKERKRSK